MPVDVGDVPRQRVDERATTAETCHVLACAGRSQAPSLVQSLHHLGFSVYPFRPYASCLSYLDVGRSHFPRFPPLFGTTTSAALVGST